MSLLDSLPSKGNISKSDPSVQIENEGLENLDPLMTGTSELSIDNSVEEETHMTEKKVARGVLDTIKVQATADDGNYVSGLLVNDKNVYINNDMSITNIELEVPYPANTGKVFSDLKAYVTPVFARAIPPYLISGANFYKKIPSSATKVVFDKNLKTLVDGAVDLSSDNSMSYFGYFDEQDGVYYVGSKNGNDILANPASNSLFYNCSNLTSVDLSSLDTSNVTSMSSMFRGCSNLMSVDVSLLDTSKTTSMSNMFNGCKVLTSLNVSSWDTSEVTDISSMFMSCNELLSLDVSSWNTSNVKNMQSVFFACNSLEKILSYSSWDTSNVSSSGSLYMFQGCSSLVGGSGTIYNKSYVDATYARIDNPPTAPGYFTLKQ